MRQTVDVTRGGKLVMTGTALVENGARIIPESFVPGPHDPEQLQKLLTPRSRDGNARSPS